MHNCHFVNGVWTVPLSPVGALTAMMKGTVTTPHQKFIFIPYRLQDDGSEIFHKIAEKIDDIHSDHSSASIHILSRL